MLRINWDTTGFDGLLVVACMRSFDMTSTAEKIQTFLGKDRMFVFRLRMKIGYWLHAGQAVTKVINTVGYLKLTADNLVRLPKNTRKISMGENGRFIVGIRLGWLTNSLKGFLKSNVAVSESCWPRYDVFTCGLFIALFNSSGLNPSAAYGMQPALQPQNYEWPLLIWHWLAVLQQLFLTTH